MATLNTVFKQVFEEGLKEYGFAKIKGRQPYFVRVVAGEILQVIAYRPEMGIPYESKGFDILAGVATVYRPSNIDFSCTPRGNLNWIRPIRYYYSEFHVIDFPKDEIWDSLCTFEYRIDDEDSMRHELERALEETKKHVLPVFGKIENLEDCIDFMRVFGAPDLDIPTYDSEKDTFVPANCPYNEGLLYIKTNNHDDFREEFAKILAKEIKEIEVGIINYSTCEKAKKGIEKWRVRIIEARDRIYNDPIAYARALQELKRRKAVNTEALREYGIDI